MKLPKKLARLVARGASFLMALSGDLPPPPDPKPKKGQVTLPSFLTTAKPSTESPLQRTQRGMVNADLTSLRNGATTSQTIRDFVKASPDLSAAVAAHVRMAVTDGYTAIAKNRDGTVNAEATNYLSQVITRMNVLSDYSQGYDSSASIRSIAETWSREIMQEGGMAGELVLDKTFLPAKIQPISWSQIRLFPSADGKRLIPDQYVGGQSISLDIPTFFAVTLDQDTTVPYPDSPIESAMQPALASAEFMNDVRRIIRKALHPRLTVTINEERFRKSLPPEVAQDQAKAIEYMNTVVLEAQAMINDLEPEEALVLFDTMGIEIVDHGNTNLSNEYTVVQGMMDAHLATGAKVLPTVLGHSDGTSNTASAEVLMFVKQVEGAVWSKLNEIFSQVFTLATRLGGFDVFVEFAFNAIDLRPKSELESFYSMRQSRVLDLLSLGLVTDEEAAIILTGHLPPSTYKPLSGTGFRATAKTEPAGSGYNGATNDGSTMNQNLKSDAPSGAKGKQKTAEVLPLHG